MTCVVPFLERAIDPLLRVSPVMELLYFVASAVTLTVVCAFISVSVPLSVAVTIVSPVAFVLFAVTVTVLVLVSAARLATLSFVLLHETLLLTPEGYTYAVKSAVLPFASSMTLEGSRLIPEGTLSGVEISPTITIASALSVPTWALILASPTETGVITAVFPLPDTVAMVASELVHVGTASIS